MNRLNSLTKLLDVVHPGRNKVMDEWVEQQQETQKVLMERISQMEERVKAANMNGELKWFLCQEDAVAVHPHEVLTDDDGIPVESL